jgi:transmembrane sensor
MNDQTLKELLEKYLTGTITGKDKTELAGLIDQPEYREKLELLMEESFMSDAFVNEENEKLRNDIQKWLKERIAENHGAKSVTLWSEDNKKSSFRRIGYRYVAAAAIFILIAVSAYFVFLKKSEKPLIAEKPTPVQNDLLPGGNKAILTLADGTTFVLDSAKNGALAVQGNTQIIKGDGTLAYNKKEQVGIAQNVVYNSVSTPKGGQYQLTLADGTRVWLNAASSIRFPTAFAGSDRRVEITGETYFEVAHNASKPFHVVVNGLDVQVLGTHFNINSYPDEESMQTTLLEGSVKVSFGSTKQTVFIKPGEQASLSKDGKLSTIKDVDVDKVIAWKNGWFEFDKTDLQAILRQISRWYDVDVVYEKNVTQEKFGGRISRNLPLSNLLELLKSNGVQFKLDGKKLIVNP